MQSRPPDVTVVSLVGNLLVIAVALHHKTRNTTNILIVGLAVADLVFIVFCVPFTAVIYTIPVWPFGTPFCKVRYFTFLSNFYSLNSHNVNRGIYRTGLGGDIPPKNFVAQLALLKAKNELIKVRQEKLKPQGYSYLQTVGQLTVHFAQV